MHIHYYNELFESETESSLSIKSYCNLAEGFIVKWLLVDYNNAVLTIS